MGTAAKALNPPAPRLDTKQPHPTRDAVIDFTKGSLVLLMVFYHWFNYFIAVESELYRYMRFLTPSFILISGFLVAAVYFKRDDESATVYWRLLERGSKLLLLFTVLNLGAGALVTRNYNGAQLDLDAFFRSAYVIYLTGNGRAAFDVLVPISYFLLLSPVLLLAVRRLRVSPHLLTGSALAGAFAASAFGVNSTNLELLAMGMVGLSLGMMPAARLSQARRRPAVLLIAYGGYLLAVTIWNVVLPLQVAGVCLSLAIICMAGDRLGDRSPAARHIMLIGRYSLVVYIAQIAVLQICRRLLLLDGVERAVVTLVLPAAVAATWMSVVLLDAMRRRIAYVDRMYRMVFA